MKRRDFIRKSFGAGIATSAALTFDPFSTLQAAEDNVKLPYDMVAVKGGEPIEMFEKGIAQLGGMKTFVKQGQTVVVKPNIGWSVTPERAANTNPDLVYAVIKHCFVAGAKKVYVFDHTCNEWTACYEKSGIEARAKEAGAAVMPGNEREYYKEVEIPKGKALKKTDVHELVLNSDVFINIPVLKHHGGAKMSLCMKNLMGIVWNRRSWHAGDLQQCIADMATYKKPDLNIVDGYRVLKRKGPRGVSVEDVATMKYQMIGTDMVALDTAACKVFGIDPEIVKHIPLAQEHGVGSMDLDSMNIKRISIS